MKKTLITLTFTGVLLAALSAHAVTVTLGAPGAQASTVPGVITETFDSQSTGLFSGATAVGTLSAGGAIHMHDSFGGAFLSDYYAVGSQSGASSATLTVNGGGTSYFGMWWSALGTDELETVKLYDGAALLGTYDYTSLSGLLTAPYLSNPNYPPGTINYQYYFYANWTAGPGEVITSVLFDNGTSTGSGFEMDNFSILGAPDGGMTVGLLGGALVGLYALRRKLS